MNGPLNPVCQNPHCGGPIPHRAHQNPMTVRACSPNCAGRLNRIENPDRAEKFTVPEGIA